MITAPAVSNHLYLAFLVRSFGFPNGMAATNRVRLLGRALVEQGVDVTVFCTRVSEHLDLVRNRSTSGITEGISYSYTTGSTVRSDSFIVRRYREARGYIVVLAKLAWLRRYGRLDCVWLTSGRESWRLGEWLLAQYARLLDVPVVLELNEIPEMLSVLERLPFLPSCVSRHLSKLDGATAAVAISRWLASWAGSEAARIHRHVDVIEVPIVVDVDEQSVTALPQAKPVLVYSAMAGYTGALSFIFGSMERVWERYPECQLVVTGRPSVEVTSVARQQHLQGRLDDGRITAPGYVQRHVLLSLYRQAAALLIPLLDDAASRARFPSKIGEYLASARPVITTRVGEIERFLHDGETAYISPPGDVEAYASNMLAVLDDPDRAASVGMAGRRLAEQQFHYGLHGPTLRAFVEGVSRPTVQNVRTPR